MNRRRILSLLLAIAVLVILGTWSRTVESPPAPIEQGAGFVEMSPVVVEPMAPNRASIARDPVPESQASDVLQIQVVLQDPRRWSPSRFIVPQFTAYPVWVPWWSTDDPLGTAVLRAVAAERARRPRLAGWNSPPHTDRIVELWAERRGCEVPGGPVDLLAALEAERRLAVRESLPDPDLVSCLHDRVQAHGRATRLQRELASLYEVVARIDGGDPHEQLVAEILELLEATPQADIGSELLEQLTRLSPREADGEQLARLADRIEEDAPGTAQLGVAGWALTQALWLNDPALASRWTAIRREQVEEACRRAGGSCEDPDQEEAEAHLALLAGGLPVSWVTAVRVVAWRCGLEATLDEPVEERLTWEDGWGVAGTSPLASCLRVGLGEVVGPARPVEVLLQVVPAP